MTTMEARKIERENGAKHAAKVAEYDVVLVHGLYTITRPDGKTTTIQERLIGDTDILRAMLETARCVGRCEIRAENLAKAEADIIPRSQLDYERKLQDYKDRGLGAASCGDNEGGAA